MQGHSRRGAGQPLTTAGFIGALVCIGILGGSIPATGQAGSYEGKTILDGVFTAAQATQGGDHYEASCVRCHEGIDPDGPTLRGRSFIDRWRESNLDSLYAHISTRMPADGAGRLSAESYIQVLAYMLGANDYPGGAEALRAEELSSIRIVGANGPQPLPNNTLVKLVGCMTPEVDGSWTLTSSTEPARTRRGKETNPIEIAGSLQTALGTRAFPLTNFTNIRYDFDPEQYAGHRVQAKGVLIRRSSGERISLTALDSVATTCD